MLDENWQGSSTLPSRTQYPHQWSWDSAFIALGRSWYDRARAQQVRKVEPQGRFEHEAWNQGGQDDIRGDREARRRDRRDQQAEGHEGDA